MTWSRIVSTARAESLQVLSRPNVELIQEPDPVDYFFCQTTGRGPFREIGRIVVDHRRTRIFVNAGVPSSELVYLTTAFLMGEKDRWDARLKFIHKGTYVNSDKAYRVMKVCRLVGEDDLSMESFEAVSLNLVAPKEHHQEVTAHALSAN